MGRVLTALSEAVLVLALLAALLGLIVPSKTLAEGSDLLLAALVLFTALGIAPGRLAAVRDRWRRALALSFAPFLVLVPAAWALSRLFDSPTREGVLSLGLAPTEIAAAGLVALAAGDAALALAVVTGSLIVSALLGPPAASLLAGGEAADGGELVARFALVVLVPLAVGASARAAMPRLARLEPQLAAASTLSVATLVYASLSGASGESDLAAALLGGGAFLLVSAAAAAFAFRRSPDLDPITAPFAIALRDFAVAAALANEAFGTRAASVAGVYGVLMLVAGALATSVLRRTHARATADP
jgi:predicted Na+-dependent transporter